MEDSVRIRLFLTRCRMFARVEPVLLERITVVCRLLTVARHTTVFRQGDPAPGLYVIGSGLVRVFRLAPNGKEHVLHLAGPGMTFAEAAALGGFACPAFAECEEECELVFLPQDELDRLLADEAALSRQLLAGMAVWVHHLVGMLEDIVLRDAAGRLARHLLERADERGQVQLPSARKHLASHLNLTPETLSRVLRRFQDAGLISSSEGELTVRDGAGLQAVVDGL